MSIQPPNGILDITGATLRVSKMEFSNVTGFDTVLNNVARNTVLHVDTTEYTANVAYAVKPPNMFMAQFDLELAAGGTGLPCNFNYYNDSNLGTSFNGYNLSFNDTSIILTYDGGSALHTATLSSSLNNGVYRKVKVLFDRDTTLVSINGENVFRFKDELRPRTYDTGTTGYIRWWHNSPVARKIKNLKVSNGEKWAQEYDSAGLSSNISYTHGLVGVGTSVPEYTLDVAGDIRASGNLIVNGSNTLINTTSLAIEDGVIECGKGNSSAAKDLGFLMVRNDGSSTTNSNVAMFWDESTDALTFGFSDSGPTATTLTPNTTKTLNSYFVGNVGIGVVTPNTTFHVVNPNATNPPWYNASYLNDSACMMVSENNYNVESARGPNTHYTTLILSSDHAYDSGNNAAGSVSFAAKNEFGGYSAQYGQISGVRLDNFYGGLSFATMHNLNDGKLREDMRITNGNVGIGTASPVTPLHISSTNEITTSPAASSVSQMRFGSTNSTVLFGVSSTAGHISAYDTSNFSTKRHLCINADGGNVGIGTTSPNRQLQIYGDSSNYFSFSPTEADDTSVDDKTNFGATSMRKQMMMRLNNRTWYWGIINNSSNNLGLGADGGGGDDPDIQCVFQNNGTFWTKNIRTSGNVGINAPIPSQTFEVAGDAAVIHIYGGADIHNTNDRALYIGGKNNGGSLIQSKCAIVSTPSASYGGAAQYGKNALHFCVGPDANNSTNASKADSRMCIKHNGNVGIGTINPSVKFHVDGSTAYDGSTTARFRCAASQYGRCQLQLIGRYEGNNDGWSATGARNALRFLYQTSSTSAYTEGWTIQHFQNGSNNDLGFLAWLHNTPMMMLRGSSGRVGIGTLNPDERLHVYNPTATARVIIERDSNTGECNLTLKAYHSSGSTEWQMYHSGANSHLYFWRAGNRGYLNWGAGNSQINFTGQHRTFIKDVPFTQAPDLEGLIVSADQNKYIKMSGGIEVGSNAITTNESLPIVTISARSKDKKCFGVISASEDPETREEVYGNFVSISEKEYGDTRVYINSVGEGAIWVTNINGNLESGDYITTSNVAGYGMKQDSEFLANYTVAKITMDCDFEPVTQPVQQIVKELSNVNYWVTTTYKDVALERYSNLTEENRQTVTTTRYSNEEGEISPGEYSNLESNVQATYSEIETTTYQQIERKESTTEQEGYTLEVREELVNVLDEHGQLQWEDDPSGATEKAYKIRYLDADGKITTEANKVHTAAFVGCTYHCG